MDNFKNKMITAMVFLAEDTNGMVIHLNGFEDPRHASNFVKKLMKKSGIEYKSILDLSELPTLH
jgi:acyl CoA:acetate/3-ketoacid CoA transferase alpha subunit